MSSSDEFEERAGVALYFGILTTFFVITPVAIMFFRLITRSAREGLMAMFTPAVDLDPAKRRLSSRLRSFLYQRTPYGYYIDVVQAVFSLISCILYIVISYMPSEPEWVTDVEDFFTVYFAIDYGVRLWLQRDSFKWYFSLVSLLDFVTVFPAITTWIIQAGGEYDTHLGVVINSIRVFRILRIFRVIRVIRLMNVSQGYAFQRQLFVLTMTVLSMVFVAGGLIQVFESTEGKNYPFHRAVYYATITVIGRPGIPIQATVSFVVCTFIVAFAATIIPTFVAELIRLWFDNASVETYRGNPEQPHVIVCGDTNVSRLRAFCMQYFHHGRDPDSQTPIVLVAEQKPEGALRAFLDQYKQSGIVRYIRGSARRAADLKRAGILLAKACVVLNYRSDKDATASDTEVLSTVMAIKNVVPTMRVLVQLYRPRKRNHLKAVPGWQDGDKSVASVSLGMTLMGLSAQIPGMSTFVTNLIRRGHALAGLPSNLVASKALPWWHLMLYGESAKAAAMATLTSKVGAGRTPLEEYSASIDQAVHEMIVPPALIGRTFGAVARLAYLRYGIMLVGATLPVNDDITGIFSGLPKTYRLILFPCDATLAPGMKLYGICQDRDIVTKFTTEHGASVRSLLSKAIETVGSAFIIGQGLDDRHIVTQGQLAREAADATPVDIAPVGNTAGWVSTDNAPPAVARELTGNENYPHNSRGTSDLNIPWCFTELEEIREAQEALLHKLQLDKLQQHIPIPAFSSAGVRLHADCPTCNMPATTVHPSSILQGCGICTAGDIPRTPDPVAAVEPVTNPLARADDTQVPAVAVASEDFNFGDVPVVSAAVTTSETILGCTESKSDGIPAAAPIPDFTASNTASNTALAFRPLVVPRRNSLGDDGLGGIDDTDDITGVHGPLLTSAPHFSHSAGITLSAKAAAKANANALAVRLALPVTAVSDVESMAADSLDTLHAAKYKGHVLVCGVSDNLGYLVRAIAAMKSKRYKPLSQSEEHVEGAQYDISPEDIVLLAPAKPGDAAINSMYAGSSLLLQKITFIAGNPSEAADLLKAGVLTARAAVVLTTSKPTVSADGSDNLSDDTDAIVTTAIIGKLNPGLHVITEILHGAHAPFLRPYGTGLTDAARGALIAILEEREASRQRLKVEDAIKRLALEREIKESADTPRHRGTRIDVLLGKLYKQQARFRAAMTGTLVFRPPPPVNLLISGPVPGGKATLTRAAPTGLRTTTQNYSMALAASTGVISAPVTTSATSNAVTAGISAAVDALESQTHRTGTFETELEQLAESGLSNSAIVDVLVGVREDFSASAAANDGAAFSMGGGGPGGGQSKGSGATNDLYASPAFAAGRAFSFNTMDAIICEGLFEPHIMNVLKQFVRAARRQRFFAIPITEAIIMTRLVMPGSPYATGGAPAHLIGAVREHYMAELAQRLIAAARGRPAATEPPRENAWMDAPVKTYAQVFEALLRGWNVLSVGLYRRVQPTHGLKANAQTNAALQLASGPPATQGSFVHNRTLISYVFTNPLPDSKLAEHDLLYVLLPDDLSSFGAGASGFSEEEDV